jgi:Fungal trichothecene efflux pump (TRI12)
MPLPRPLHLRLLTGDLCFSLPIGAVSILVIIFILKIPRQDNASGKPIRERIMELDLLGASILIPTVIMLLLALQWGGTKYPWNNSRIIGLLVGAGVLAIIFAYTQIHLGEAATLPPRILTQRSVLAGSVFAVMFGAAFFVLIFYLPLYFQSVKGVSATRSGIEVLPLLLATVLSSIISGGLITLVGYYVPFIVGGTALFCIGSGFISTYSTHTPLGKWFGYQVLTGAGIGVGFQGPMLAVQTVLPLEDVPIGTACVMFFQTLGGALFISVGQTVFQNGLVRGTRQFTPDIDPKLLLNAGATMIRSVLQRIGKLNELANAIEAYMVGLKDAYRVTIACSAVAFLAACFLEWRSVKDGESKRRGEEGGVPAVAV